LSLSHNNVSSAGVTDLTTTLRHLRHLTSLEIKLDKANVDANGTRILGLALPEFAPLQHICISLIHNNLTEKGVWPLTHGIVKQSKTLTSLKLILISNGLKEEAGELLSTMLFALPSLSTLNINLYSNKLG
jgi:hypothetical protein